MRAVLDSILLSLVSIAMGADYAFYVKTIETHVRAFLALNILAIGRVRRVQNQDPKSWV